jgi:hypothetical protein
MLRKEIDPQSHSYHFIHVLKGSLGFESDVSNRFKRKKAKKKGLRSQFVGYLDNHFNRITLLILLC